MSIFKYVVEQNQANKQIIQWYSSASKQLPCLLFGFLVLQLPMARKLFIDFRGGGGDVSTKSGIS
jgi:hypothetical protein